MTTKPPIELIDKVKQAIAPYMKGKLLAAYEYGSHRRRHVSQLDNISNDDVAKAAIAAMGDASTRKDEEAASPDAVSSNSPTNPCEISDVVTVRRVIDDMSHVAGKGVKFTLRYLEYENDELGQSTGTIDLADVVVPHLAECPHTWPGKRIGMRCSDCLPVPVMSAAPLGKCAYAIEQYQDKTKDYTFTGSAKAVLDAAGVPYVE